MSGRKLTGFSVMAVGAAACAWGLYRLIQTGSCANGGARAIARPCPEGTGLDIAAVLGGAAGVVAGTVLAGLVIAAVAPVILALVGGASLAAGALDPPPGTGSFPFWFGGICLAFGGVLLGIGPGAKQGWTKRPAKGES